LVKAGTLKIWEKKAEKKMTSRGKKLLVESESKGLSREVKAKKGKKENRLAFGGRRRKKPQQG